MSDLAKRIAGALAAGAADLCSRWQARAPVVSAVAAPGQFDRSATVAAEVTQLLGAIAESLTGGTRAAPVLAAAGWRFGTKRFDAGCVLPQMLHELELLSAIVLHEAERVASRGEDRGSAGEGLAVARGIQRATSLATFAAVRGFTGAHVERQRVRLRTIRHDLRNPLGTIRNAVALFDDDSIPAHRRDPARLHAMVARNAAQADALVERNLVDGLKGDDALGQRVVAVGDVAIAVRRVLRDELDAAGAEIVVSSDLPVVRTDAASLELVLLVALAGAIAGMGGDREAPARIIVEPDAKSEQSVRVRISGVTGRLSELPGVLLAREIAQWAGGELTMPDALVVELPMSPGESGDDLRPSLGESGDDLRRPDER